ncbi:glycoside hydrolase family 3 C-terminal domain-containing protein [Carboxylicivirga sp. A043]|uniref:glycoside hydrolase family 3 protein n=1 Tax=Carboxylicivirga litoralis TaxID=2816963 RepID=UPI0021CB92BF|nr:glycoside hydrolase family 3 N-terminal domain-containing protein [Carboxylicivirga sp. A043]MCU4156433.1 glycoside hydrolase family 3 C-terminal domain-containing protein [Carboxylicivirga sp. A043]
MYKTIFFVVILGVLVGCSSKWKCTETDDGFNIVQNNNGVTLSYSPYSGVSIIEDNGYAFKDLNKNGGLDAYEDWRLPAEERAKDLASKLSIEEIAGLMLYSNHQSVPATYMGKYDGKEYKEANVPASTLTDEQKKFLLEDNLRHILVTGVENAKVAAQWNNKVQTLVEGFGFGIPANNSSDPRHGAPSDAEFFAGAGGDISRWSQSLGLAASFDPELVRKFGEVAAIEYRALGLTTALSPQVDISTDPRWDRFVGTFGESPQLSADMAKAYCEGFQYSSPDKVIEDGWGYESVNAMVKHWPGGGSGEGGRDAHMGTGKYGVFPGKNLEDHKKPFLDGAFKLDNKTKMASAVMPYYTISYNQDPSGKNVGNGFSEYLIKDQLRGKYGYDGVVCTDWVITGDAPIKYIHAGKPWGIETLSEAERHYLALMAGIDQFGGNNQSGPIIEAYEMGVKEHGDAFMRQRMEQSTVRLLKNIFRVGLFENPYLSPKKSDAIVGKPEFMQLGYESQLKSVVLLKNKNKLLPLQKKTKVYIPSIKAFKRDFFGGDAFTVNDGINKAIAAKYFKVVDTPEEADVALVMMNSPYNLQIRSGFDITDFENGGNGYVPITLQYKEYTAHAARERSLAFDSNEHEATRSYKGKSVLAKNHEQLDVLLNTKKAMGDKPVVVIINSFNPTVVAEFESQVDGLLLHFRNQDQALLDVISGAYEPSGLLPFQMPSSMETVEKQLEDVPFDMDCYVDSEGHKYEFTFGMNWSGVISDERVKKYAK